MAQHRAEVKKRHGRQPEHQSGDTRSLREVFEGLYVRRSAPGGQIDGSELASALQRLVAAEVAPGGPYQDPDGVIDSLANAYIAHFLALEGVHLPNLQVFAAQHPEVMPNHEAQAAPHRVTSAAVRHPALLAAVNKGVHRELAILPELLATMGEAAFARLLRADTSGEIRLMPQLMLGALAMPPQVRHSRLVRLGAANVFFWIGGMTFDDFLDGEGQPQQLPIATVLHRRALTLYRLLDADPDWHALLEDYCNRADHANAWEVTNARAYVQDGVITLGPPPEYGDGWALADRSIGHLFGPLYVLRRAHISRRQLVSAREALRHYLIARQLNDDLHDWREDIAAGQLTMVVAVLLRGSNVLPGQYRLDELVPRLERYFFDTGLEEVCAVLLAHIADARALLMHAGITKGRGGIYDLLRYQEASASAALKSHADRRAFLRTFESA